MRKTILFLVLVSLLGCSNAAPGDRYLSFLYPTFYMKVVDQDNLPVQGVGLNIVYITNSWLDSSIGPIKYTSDVNGIIPIKIDSRRISIKDVKKEGYRILWDEINYRYHKGRNGYFWPENIKKFTREKPFLIPVWRKDNKEEQATCINGRISERLISDGRIYTINLPLGHQKYIGSKRNIGLDIQISFKRDAIKRTKQKLAIKIDGLQTKWQFNIHIPDGGIIEIDSKDVYQKSPPKSGYVSDWKLATNDFKSAGTAYQGYSYLDMRHFYVKTKDNIYARVSIIFAPIGVDYDGYEYGDVSIHYSLDIYGSGYVHGYEYGGAGNDYLFNLNGSSYVHGSVNNSCVNL